MEKSKHGVREIDWSDIATTSLTLAYNHNETEITDQSMVGGVNPVSDGLIEDIENNYPEDRFVLTTNTFFGDDWNFMVRATFYGEHWDERGRIGDAVDPSAKIDSTIYLDMELGYQFNDNFKLTAGAINVFDEFIDEIGPPNSNRLSVGLQYPRRSAAPNSDRSHVPHR